ncbi:RNA polymerase sigma factor [Clostridium sp. UBA1652]|uniref:RNA polymerase sigma factor n=1 Tax=Clostridium sp. UBA1652 TaxID=1946348 RepID=UPI00257B365A|nr:sigma-70 family RNA polymerase sigma factor [Clostridium sp. UBA1652]
MDLRNKFKNVQRGNKDDLLEIIFYFENIISNLSKKLLYPEAKTDLIIHLIELSIKINLEKYKDSQSIKAFLIKALKNKQIDLFRKNIVNHRENIELNLDIFINDESSTFESDYGAKDLIDKLSPTQQLIVSKSIFDDLSDSEIAKDLGISRQSVFKTKKTALKNLKLYVQGD